MPKITFVGAGSFGFTRKLVRDVLTFPLLESATICLMDIDAERLDYSRRAIERIVNEGNYPATIETTMDREVALAGADYVVVTILAGGVDVWRHDIEIPKKYGVDINIGDTRGPSGIFRAARTVPVMLDPAVLDAGEVDRRLATRAIRELQHFNGAVHCAQFALPNHLRVLLA